MTSLAKTERLSDNATADPLPSVTARHAYRAGLAASTAGVANGFVQGNLAILPEKLAASFHRFCQLNPKPCPIIGMSDVGDPRIPSLGLDLDIRTDIPRYRVWRHSRVSLWVKGVAGGGWITTPNYPRAGSLQGSYLAYGLGGTVDYRLSRRLILRADYEYQIWPSFAGPVTYSATGAPIYHNSGLSPNGVSVGVNYRFFGH